MPSVLPVTEIPTGNGFVAISGTWSEGGNLNVYWNTVEDPNTEYFYVYVDFTGIHLAYLTSGIVSKVYNLTTEGRATTGTSSYIFQICDNALQVYVDGDLAAISVKDDAWGHIGSASADYGPNSGYFTPIAHSTGTSDCPAPVTSSSVASSSSSSKPPKKHNDATMWMIVAIVFIVLFAVMAGIAGLSAFQLWKMRKISSVLPFGKK